MQKRDESRLSHSCWNKARSDEWVFVLLGRDEAAPRAIRAWVKERIRLGNNQAGDDQTEEALRCAEAMEHSA